jgi:predicted nucleic acid-binding Zn ribbon protein
VSGDLPADADHSEVQPPEDETAQQDRPSARKDPARSLLDRLRSAPAAPTHPRVRRGRRYVSPDDQHWSGPVADERDPGRLSDGVAKVVEDQGWRRTLDEASLEPRWAQIVGSAVAEHARPDRLVAGELTVVASSTAWATQIRLMSRQLLGRIAAEVGENVVTRITVRGPTTPDWRHGPLRVRGRGPRDTYG